MLCVKADAGVTNAFARLIAPEPERFVPAPKPYAVVANVVFHFVVRRNPGIAT